jgi:hypothetical protein
MPYLLSVLGSNVFHVPLNKLLIHPPLDRESSNIHILTGHFQDRFPILHNHPQNGCTGNFPILLAADLCHKNQ